MAELSDLLYEEIRASTITVGGFRRFISQYGVNFIDKGPVLAIGDVRTVAIDHIQKLVAKCVDKLLEESAIVTSAEIEEAVAKSLGPETETLTRNRQNYSSPRSDLTPDFNPYLDNPLRWGLNFENLILNEAAHRFLGDRHLGNSTEINYGVGRVSYPRMHIYFRNKATLNKYLRKVLIPDRRFPALIYWDILKQNIGQVLIPIGKSTTYKYRFEPIKK
jgi:hypothetical protein|tara:strand:- start:53 stop:709 length:657 start_codon:yes stop_codon:yes gene_type:complete